MCPRGDPTWYADALSLWAVDVYRLLDPGLQGIVPFAAVMEFDPREVDALQVVQQEVVRWRNAKSG